MIKFRLDELLEKRGWTAYQLAKESGIHPSVLSKYVNNQVKAVSLETLELICSTLGCRPGDLIDYVPDQRASRRK